jgi:hypothetical protein
MSEEDCLGARFEILSTSYLVRSLLNRLRLSALGRDTSPGQTNPRCKIATFAWGAPEAVAWGTPPTLVDVRAKPIDGLTP